MVIKQNKTHTFGGFISCLLTLVLFVLVVVIDFQPFLDDTSDVVMYWIVRALSVVCIPYLLFGVVYFFVQLFSNEPLLEINDIALVDNSSAISLGTIYWRDMQRAYIKGTFLAIELKHPEEYLQKANFIKRFLMKVNKKLGFDYVCITAQRFRKSAPDFFKALNEKINIEVI